MNISHDDDNAVFNIGTAARRSGLSVTTIRTWEDRYGAVVPRRDHSGRRLYSEHQIAQLTWLRRQVENGLQASEAHRLLGSDRETIGTPGAFQPGDATTPWVTMMAWTESEQGWVTSMMGDLSSRLGSEGVGLGAVISNPSYGPIVSVILRSAQLGDTDPLRPLAAVVAADVSGLSEALEKGSVMTVNGDHLGNKSMVIAPIRAEGVSAGVLVLVAPTADDPESLLEKAARVIEARIEADRARHAFARLLD